MILDGLAWAGISEPARIARISARLVRQLGTYRSEHTKSDVKEAVRGTSPPYGRGKAIYEAVEVEYRRQLPIFAARKERHEAWENYQEHIAKRETRINHAYAAAFDRPVWEPARKNPYSYGDDQYYSWNEEEQKRDKGDDCIGLTHQGGHVVCLVQHENGITAWNIATRHKRGPIVRTYLRCNLGGRTGQPQNLVEAAISLGGPKVRSALAKGKKVVTDWAGRRTFIHHEGQDHEKVWVEELPWRAVVFIEEPTGYNGSMVRRAKAALIHGDAVTLDPDNDYVRSWNDID